jgi:hypothetical protein
MPNGFQVKALRVDPAAFNFTAKQLEKWLFQMFLDFACEDF